MGRCTGRRPGKRFRRRTDHQQHHVKLREKINELFFEILIAPRYDEDALAILKSKKNRITPQQKQPLHPEREFKRILNGVLVQDADKTNYAAWTEAGARNATDAGKAGP